MLEVDVRAEMGALRLSAKLPAHDGTTVLVGPNGAGKSTLLKCILGVARPRAGTIRLADETLFDADRGVDIPPEDRRLGYVPQRYALFTHMTVAQNVGFGIRNRDERATRVRALLEELGIADLADRRTPGLSGGESQRVALARALAIQPRAILLDEPMAALDASVRRRVRTFLSERLQGVRIPTIVVSHDIDDVRMFGGRIAVLEAGKVVQVGSLDALRRDPATEFVREFLGTTTPEDAPPKRQ